jgi:hypothetical protein
MCVYTYVHPLTCVATGLWARGGMSPPQECYALGNLAPTLETYYITHMSKTSMTI